MREEEECKGRRWMPEKGDEEMVSLERWDEKRRHERGKRIVRE